MKGKILKAYKREHAHSYASGAYATMELLNNNPGIVEAVYIHSKYTGKEDIGKLCRDNDVPVLYNDRAFERINQKENSYVLGVFCKYTCRLLPDRPHIVLVNPGDMGNLGTIIRTMAGMNIPDLAVIEPAADIFHPKTVRASMGSLFHIRFQCFQSFEAYRDAFPGHACYPFTPDGETLLNWENCPRVRLFSLLFGNESTGLPDCCKLAGPGVRIWQSPLVDSLNLAVAAGIGMYIFACKNELISLC